MKLYIIGAGAIGKALAVCLSQNGKEAELIRGSIANGTRHIQTLSLNLQSGERITAEIPFNYLDNIARFEGLIVLTTKSFGNKNLAEKLKEKALQTPLVILQNGLGIEQPFIDYQFQELYRCVLFATSQNSTSGSVSYKPVKPSPIGVVTQHSSSLQSIVSALDTPGFRFIEEEQIFPVIWKKAIANCVFNSICPLLEVDNGIFQRDPQVFAIAQQIIQECVLIAHKKGIALSPEEVEDQVLTISKLSDGQLISTLQDIRNHKETEIDTLNLEIFRMAEQLNLASQVQQTKLLGELVQIKSRLNL